MKALTNNEMQALEAGAPPAAIFHPGCGPLIPNVLGFLVGNAPLNVQLFFPPGLPNAHQDCAVDNIFPPGLEA